MLYSKTLFTDRAGKCFRCFVEEGGSHDFIVALLKQGGAKLCKQLSQIKDHSRRHFVVARIQYKANDLVSIWGWIPVDIEWVIKSCSLNCVQEVEKYRLGTRQRYSSVFDSERRKLFNQLERDGLFNGDYGDQNSQETEPRVPCATSTQNTAAETVESIPLSQAPPSVDSSKTSQQEELQPDKHRFKPVKKSRDRPPLGREVHASGNKVSSQQSFRMLVQQNETKTDSVLNLQPIPTPLPPRMLVDSSTSPTFPELAKEMAFSTRVSTWKQSKPFSTSRSPYRASDGLQRDRPAVTFVEDGQVPGCSRDSTVPEAVVAKRKQLVATPNTSKKKSRLLNEIVISSGSEEEIEPAATRQPTLHYPQPTSSARQQKISSRSSSNKGLYLWAEKRAILEYIVNKQGYYRVRGNAIWEEMEEARVCPGRTHQSMKEHFRKQLFPNISYVPFLTDHQKELFKKYNNYDFRKRGIPVALASPALRQPLCVSPESSSSTSPQQSPPLQRRRVEPTERTAPSTSVLTVSGGGMRRLFRQRSLTPISEHQAPAQPLPALVADQPNNHTASDPAATAPVVASTAPSISAAAARSLEVERCFIEAVKQQSSSRTFKRITQRPESSDEEDELNNPVNAVAPADAASPARVTSTDSVETKGKTPESRLRLPESPIHEREGSQELVENSPIALFPNRSLVSIKTPILEERLAKIRRTLNLPPIGTASAVDVAEAELETGFCPLRGETEDFEEETRLLREGRVESEVLAGGTPPPVPENSVAAVVLETSGDSTDDENELRTGKNKDHTLPVKTLISKLKELQSEEAMKSKEVHSNTEGILPKLQKNIPKPKKRAEKTKGISKKSKEPANSQHDEVAEKTVDTAVGTRSTELKVASPSTSPRQSDFVAHSGTVVASGSAKCEIPPMESASPVFPKSSQLELAPAVGAEDQSFSASRRIRVRSPKELNNTNDLLKEQHIAARAVKEELGTSRTGCTAAADIDDTETLEVELNSDNEECVGDLALQEADRLRFIASIQQMTEESLIEVTPDNELVLNIRATNPVLSEGRELDAVSALCLSCGWLALYADVSFHDERACLAFCPHCPQEGAEGTLLKLLFWLELTVTVGNELMRVIAAGPVAERLFCCSPTEYLFVEPSRKLFSAKLSTSLRYHGTLIVAVTKPRLQPVLPTGSSEKLSPKSTKQGMLIQQELLSTAEQPQALDLPTELCKEDSDVLIFLGRLLE